MMYWVGTLAVAAIPLLLVWVYELYKRGESARRRAYKYLGETLDLEEENDKLRLELRDVLLVAIERGELLGYDDGDYKWRLYRLEDVYGTDTIDAACSTEHREVRE